MEENKTLDGSNSQLSIWEQGGGQTSFSAVSHMNYWPTGSMNNNKL